MVGGANVSNAVTENSIVSEATITNTEIQNDASVVVNELPKVAETPAAVSSVVEEKMELPVAKTTEGEENK
jgi:hypothetical protein